MEYNTEMPRYVILEHDYPVLHWDLLLEFGEVLKAWRLREKPEAGKTIDAEASFDHRLMYLDYEGPVSGERGNVIRWDWGEYSSTDSDPGGWELHLQSNRWSTTSALLLKIAGIHWRFQVRANL